MKDEETTTPPAVGSRWEHVENKKTYTVEGLRKVKWPGDGHWYDGIDYKNDSGEKFWRTFRDFYKNFSEVPQAKTDIAAG